MPVDPVSIGMLALKYGPTIKAGFEWLTKKSVPKRSASMSQYEKRYVGFLRDRANQGMGREAVNQQLGMTSRTVGQMGQIGKANVMGVNVAQGMEGSSVMAEQLVGVDTTGQVQMAQTARNIAMQNLQIKKDAEMQLGNYGIRQTDQSYREALENRARQDESANAFIGSLSGMAGNYLSGQEDAAWQADLQAEPWWEKLSPDLKAKLMYGGK
jgi:hypothetical protein